MEFQLLRPYTRRLAVAAVCLLLAVAAQLILPMVAGDYVDAFTSGDVSQFWSYGLLAAAVLTVLGTFASTAQRYLTRTTAAAVVASLRTRLYSVLLRQPIEFFDEQDVGALASRISSDVERFEIVLVGVAPAIAQSLPVLFGSVALLIFLSPSLALLSIIVFLPALIVTRWSGRVILEVSKDTQDALADCSHQAVEGFANIRQVHILELFDAFTRRYSAAATRAKLRSFTTARWISVVIAVDMLTRLTGVGVVVGVGGRLVGDGALTVGEFSQFLMYAALAANAVSSLQMSYHDWSVARGGSESAFALLELHDGPEEDGGREHRAGEPAVAPFGASRKHHDADVVIAFENVSFSYPSRPMQRVLDRVSFELRRGETVALVGASGSGKTSITSLLLGLYTPDEGQILVDGRPLRSLSMAECRRSVALVEQEPSLFAGTIRENILGGLNADETTDEAFAEATRDAQVDEFVAALPDGYETPVGTRGLQLSGGQKQRVAIARAILRRPRLLILDEATSALDEAGRERVESALRPLVDNTTTLIVTHETSTMLNVTRVMMMESGALKEVAS